MIKIEYSITKLRKRLFAGILAITFLFLLIFYRTFIVTVVQGENLREKAIDQWTRELPVKAQRGDITDRNGVILAGSKGSYAVFVRPRCVTNLSEVCTVLSKIFDKLS